MSKDGVLLTRRGDPSDPLPSRSNPASQLTGLVLSYTSLLKGI